MLSIFFYQNTVKILLSLWRSVFNFRSSQGAHIENQGQGHKKISFVLLYFSEFFYLEWLLETLKPELYKKILILSP